MPYPKIVIAPQEMPLRTLFVYIQKVLLEKLLKSEYRSKQPPGQ